MFTDDRPFRASYQRWGSGRLKCSGDGLRALRSIDHHHDERAAANDARQRGAKSFEISRCYTNGCAYASQDCKPHGQLQFQLIWKPQLGGVAQLDTTSIRSIINIHSCLDSFYRFTGSGNPERGYVAGIPVKLVLSPFKVTIPGSNKSSIAYQVSLAFRSETVGALRNKMMEAAKQWRSAMARSPIPETEARQIAGPELLALPAPGLAEDEQIEGAIMAAEFAPDGPTVAPNGSGVAEARPARPDPRLHRRLPAGRARERRSVQPRRDLGGHGL